LLEGKTISARIRSSGRCASSIIVVADIRTRGPFNALQFRLPFLSADSERRTPARPRVPSLIISSFRQRRRKENEKKRKKQKRKNKKEREKGKGVTERKMREMK